MSGTLYDISAENHTQQIAHVVAHFNDRTSHSLSMWEGRGSGLEILANPGTPTHATIIMYRSVAVIESPPPESGLPDQEVIDSPEPYPDTVIDHRRTSFIKNEYHHEIALPQIPELYGNNNMVAMFHVYTCHVEVDLDPIYFEKTNVPVDQLSNSWTYKEANNKFRFRKPRYNPQCPPFDGGIYEIDLNGGYKKIGDRGVCESDDSGNCVKTREIRDLPPGLVEIPEK